MKQLFRITALIAITAIFGSVLAAGAEATSTDPDANRLLAKHAYLAPRLAQNEFGRPLALESQETSRSVSGDVYAEIDSSFDTVSKSFANPRTWCEVLILHVNTKFCRAGVGADPNRLSVRFGKKGPQDLNDAFALTFTFRLEANREDYMAALLTAPTGPLGTQNYRFELQAVPLPGGRSFMRLHYSYAFGAMARLATQGYLATGGRGKVGFSHVPTGGGPNNYIGGMRGVAERNTMRYYLAVEAYLGSLTQPTGRQFSSRIEHWFDATERYRLQLHEMDRSTYLSMKRSEYARQQTVVDR